MNFEDLADIIKYPMEKLNGFITCQEQIGCMYRDFTIIKKDGRLRKISEPYFELKLLQRQVYKNMLAAENLHEACFGFRPGRNIKDNAAMHVGKDLVMCFDLRDFFETINARQVYSVFFDILKEKHLAVFLTFLVTRNGILPQGAPTSPMIANLVCRRLDARLFGLARSLSGGQYTRYADDLTFSGPKYIESLLPAIHKIISEEGWAIVPEKTRLMHKNQRQMVTGLVVNERVSVPRELRRKLRAVLHHKENGRAIHWRYAFFSKRRLQGYIQYVKSIHPSG